MKKVLSIILIGALAATMCAVLAGCGGNANSSSNTGTTQVFTKNSVGATNPSSTVATGSSNGEGVSATNATDENGNVVSEASENSNESSSNSESGSSSSSSSSASNENGGGSDDWRGEQAKQYLGVDGEEGVNTSVEDSYVVNGVSYYRVRVTGSQTFDEATLFVGDNGEVLNLSTFKMLLDAQENGGNQGGGNGGDEYNNVAPYVGD